MSSMKTGTPGGQSVAERDPRLANSNGGVVADQRLRDLDTPNSERVFGTSPAPAKSGSGGKDPRESENLREASNAAPTTP